MALTPWIAAGSALLNIGSSIWGANKARQEQQKANQKMNQYYDRRLSDLDSFFNKEYYTDYLNTKRGKHLVNTYQDKMDEMLDKNEQNAVSSGATAEAEVAAKDEAQENYSNFVSDISSKAAERKRQLKRNYRRQKNNLLGQKAKFNYQTQANKAQNWSGLGQNIASALSGLTTASAEGAFDDWFGSN